MKLKPSIIALVFVQSLTSQFLMAQTTASSKDGSSKLMSEVDSEIEKIYQASQPVADSKAQSKVEAVAAPNTATVVTTQTVVTPAPVQKQPEVIIEASPLSASKVTEIKKNRQDAELATEAKIAEKLEQSRLEDEKRRVEALFGDKLSTSKETSSTTVTAPAVTTATTAAPIVSQTIVAPQPIVVAVPVVEKTEQKALSKEDIREEVRAVLAAEETASPVVEQRYFSANAGIGQYPDYQNITGNYSLGAAFGTRYDFFLVEGAFALSNFTIDDALYVTNSGILVRDSYEMNQYQGSLSTKYQLLGGLVRPVVGGMISYSYRKYSTATSFTTGQVGEDIANSHAIDLGLIAGVDFELNSKTSLGVDFKYQFNLANKLSGRPAQGATPLEKLQYFTTGVFARVNF